MPILINTSEVIRDAVGYAATFLVADSRSLPCIFRPSAFNHGIVLLGALNALLGSADSSVADLFILCHTKLYRIASIKRSRQLLSLTKEALRLLIA
jgi:hypothetical protein